MRTYISLFSSAGVGCYGFKMNGFDCIATNELLPVRLEVQRANNKCKYDSGYICGDIRKEQVHQRLFDEIGRWKENDGLEQVDVIFATPPCQGMSTVNYKKNDHEQIRNSLVVEAIKIIMQVRPKVFVFENVRAFMKSVCTDVCGKDMLISESIYRNLGNDYNIHYEILNFKDFGVPSSRPRTIVIGTSKDIPEISPLNLFPTRRKEITLRQAIGDFTHLEFGQKDAHDPLHFARPFPEHQIEWISDLVEGQSAFDKPLERQPYKIDDKGNKVILKGAYMGNKYRRLFWDRPCACIATRNDVLSSQDTIHPKDNRVLSIRELMRLMTIPDAFVWSEDDKNLTVDNEETYLRKHEMNIRHCIGEAVPTEIIRNISGKITQMLDYVDYVRRGVRPNYKNYYIENSDIISPQSEIFDEIREMDTDNAKVSITVNSTIKLIDYLPQLCSLFSMSDTLYINVYGCSDKQGNDRLSRSLKLLQLGSNVEIDETRKDMRYDYQIDDTIEEYQIARQLELFG